MQRNLFLSCLQFHSGSEPDQQAVLLRFFSLIQITISRWIFESNLFSVI